MNFTLLAADDPRTTAEVVGEVITLVASMGFCAFVLWLFFRD